MKVLIVPVLVAALTGTAWAQAQTRVPAGQQETALLARGWSALAAQQSAKALEAAQQLLRSDPASHNAAALAIAASTAGGQPMQGLDLYEAWLAASAHEDLFLLRPIAVSVLGQLARHKEPRVRLAALTALAEWGDDDARQALQQAAGDQNTPIETEAALAIAGDQTAIGRLEAQIKSAGPRDTSRAIDALAKANAGSAVPTLIAALKSPAPPSRIAAANALADLGAAQAIPALKAALQDPDPAARNMMAVALARLGDASGGMTLQDLENSPLAEYRLLAAEAAAKADPQGPWADKVRALMTDPDPLLRLKAIGLLLAHGRETEAAGAALVTALADEAPGVRTEAAEILKAAGRERPSSQDPAALRRLLRDRVPDVQIAAASALLGSRR
jgi:HEAT repeat protein